MKKLDTEPRLGAAGATVLEWARKVAQAVNGIVDDFVGFTIARGSPAGSVVATLKASGANKSSVLSLDKAADGAASALQGRKAGLLRWQIDLGNATAETGANSGSDFTVTRCNDAGNYLGTALSILRATGQISLNGPVVLASSISAAPGQGYAVNGSFPDGSGNYAAQGLLVSPSWESCSIQGFHVPGVWAGFRMIVGSSAPAVFEFRNNGQAYCAAWNSTSDRRLKSNLEPIASASDKVQKLCGYAYDREDLRDSITGQIPRMAGLMAQDVEVVLPESVQTDSSGVKTVNYNGPIALLVNAFNEQRERIDGMQQLIAALRAEVDILKGA